MWEKIAGRSREAAREGIVLLKNEGRMLPVRSHERLAVFGRCQIDYYRSGTGSGGAVNVKYTTNILDGIRANKMLLHEGLVKIYQNWLNGHPFDNGGGGWAAEPWFQEEMPVDKDLAGEIAAKADKAVFVIGRTAGEDKDNQREAGSYYLTEQEKENLRVVLEAFSNVVVVLNVSNIIDMSWLTTEEFQSVKAVLYVWQGGMEGGLAVGDVLCGAAGPSGKLPDTIAYRLEDYPADRNFGNQDQNVYEEDIYVGYRYFETFHPEQVQFGFGYGLTYAEFDIKVSDAKINEDNIEIKADVTNVGTEFSGKEVVQIYFQAPQGKLGKPVKQLAAFEKTGLLKPGQMQRLSFSIPASRMASYDDGGAAGYKSCYVLEAGDYKFYLGNSLQNATVLSGCIYHLDDIRVIEQLSEAMAPRQQFKILKPERDEEDGGYRKQYVAVSSRKSDLAARIQAKLPADIPMTGNMDITLQAVRDGKAGLREFIGQLSIEELAMLVRGEGMSHPKVTKGTASAFGGVSDSLMFCYGIPLVCCADGPSGLRMEAKSTQLPIGTQLAASWNPELVEELYAVEGDLMCEHQVEVLLGPGMNIHRHPLNGRNFEYYSEDPYLTGAFGGAVIRGLKRAGVSGTIKHFALNSQESHRHSVDAVCSERAIREIYLKGFEMVIKEGLCDAVMTAYNPVNGHWTASNYDLNTTILREEWGFAGIVMSDWWARMNDVAEGGAASDKVIRDMIRAQNDLYMVVNNNGAEINSNGDNTVESIENGRLTVGELQRCGVNICRFILNTPAMQREIKGEEDAAYFAPIEGEIADRTVVIPGADGEIPVGKAAVIPVRMEREGIYTIIVKIRSHLSNLSQSTARLKLNGETVTTVQTNGTEGKWLTQKLLKVHLGKGGYILSFEHVQPGLEFEYVRFKREYDLLQS